MTSWTVEDYADPMDTPPTEPTPEQIKSEQAEHLKRFYA